MLSKIKELNSHLLHTGKNAVVVGGTSGIGRGIAKRLSQAGFDVTIVGRNEKAAQEDLEIILCDAQLLKTGLTFADQFKAEKLDCLVMTQGIATLQGRTETTEGIDQKMALHYYGRVAFTLGLLPLLQKSKTPTVTSVFSAGIHGEYADYKTDPQLKEKYSLGNCANATGFYNDLAFDQFSRLGGNENIRFTHAAPGGVNTNWGSEFPWILRMALKPINPFLRTIDDCAEYMCQGILQEHKPGFFLINQYGEPAKALPSHTPEAREFIWNDTMSIMKACGWK